MKNLLYFIFLFFVLVVFVTPAKAVQDTNELYQLYCPREPYDLTNIFSRGVQHVTGLNLIASKVAESQIEKTIKSFAQGDIDVDVKSFSATDAKNGRFRSFTIKGKDIDFYSVYISEFKAKTACNFIYLDLEKDPVELKEPMAIDFEAKFDEKDMNNMLRSITYNKYMLTVKYSSKSLKLLELKRPRVSLKNNKFNFAVDVRIPFITSFTLKMDSGLKVANNKIKIDNMHIGSASKTMDISLVKYFMNVLNPLWFAQLNLQEHNCKFILKNVKIENEKIVVSGTVFLGRS